MGGALREVHRSTIGHNIFVYDNEAKVRALTPDLRGLAALGTDPGHRPIYRDSSGYKQ